VDLAEFQLSEKPGGRCRFPRLLTELESEDAEKLLQALPAPDVPHVGVQRWLNDRGIDIKYNAVLRHRNGHCTCG